MEKYVRDFMQKAMKRLFQCFIKEPFLRLKLKQAFKRKEELFLDIFP